MENNNEMQKKWFKRPLMIVNALIVLASLVLSAVVIFSNGAPTEIRMASVASVIAAVSALFYIFNNGKKDYALAYRIFLIFYAVNILFCATVFIFTDLGNQDAPVLPLIFYLLTLSIVFILYSALDLGMTKSILLCIVVILLCLYIFIGNFTALPGTLSSDVFGIYQGATQVGLAVAILLATVTKYQDKKMRGRSLN